MNPEARELLREEMRIDHTDRQMEREHVAHEEGDEFWKDPSAWEGPEPGRCGSCGQFVGDGAIICHSCDVAERRREFEAMLP